MHLLAAYLSCLCLLGVSTPRQPMVLSSDILAFFSDVPGSTALDVVRPLPQARPPFPLRHRRSLGKKKSSSRPQASDLSAVVADDCCLKQCDRHFADSKRDYYSFDLLRAEHQRYQALDSEPARKNFAIQKVPLQRKHSTTSCFAGNQRVCVGSSSRPCFLFPTTSSTPRKEHPALEHRATSGTSVCCCCLSIGRHTYTKGGRKSHTQQQRSRRERKVVQVYAYKYASCMQRAEKTEFRGPAQ